MRWEELAKRAVPFAPRDMADIDTTQENRLSRSYGVCIGRVPSAAAIAIFVAVVTTPSWLSSQTGTTPLCFAASLPVTVRAEGLSEVVAPITVTCRIDPLADLPESVSVTSTAPIVSENCSLSVVGRPTRLPHRREDQKRFS